MTHQSTQLWLKTASLLLIAVGVFFSWATSGPLSAVNEGFVDLVFWPLDGAQTYAAAETRLLSGIAGGLTVGLGLAVWMVTREVFAHDPARARRIILVMMLGWFLVDSTGSIIAGAWFNVVANCAILAFVCWPLARQARRIQELEEATSTVFTELN